MGLQLKELNRLFIATPRLLEGLVGYWRMEEDGWDGTAGEVIDSSGEGNHGVAVNGVTTIAGGIIGRAGDFTTASKHYLNIGNVGGYTDNFSVAAWIKSSLNGAFQGIVTKGQVTPFNGWSITKHSNNKISVLITDTGTYTWLYSNSAYTDTDLHLVGLVRENGTNCLYVDGDKQTDTNTQTLSVSSLDTMIGKLYNDQDQHYFNGLLDEVAIWNRVLLESEVAELYNSGAGKIIAETTFQLPLEVRDITPKLEVIEI